MSDSRLVRNSPDLARLVAEGYSIRIVNGFLVIDDIPFATADAEVARGSLLCPLDTSGDHTIRPSTHIMCFAGGQPRARDGQPIDGLINPGVECWAPSPDLVANCGFSQKPRPDGYVDFYEKVVYYAAMVIGPAQALKPDASPLCFKPVATDEDDGVHTYLDTFSSRAGITARNQLLAVRKVVIIGLGGTGSYMLDLLAKTPVQEIHLYDDDTFVTHNAFRAPGAASLEELRAGRTKVDHHALDYARMHRRIRPHPIRMTAQNVAEILDADFAFLAMDSSLDKKAVIDALTAARVPFVDTGIGVSDGPNGIAGQIRITSSTPGNHDHIARDGLVSYVADENADYDTNLQVAELNMLAAVQAVLRFKKHFGYYADAERERHCVYVTDINEIYNRYGEMDRDRTAGTKPVAPDHAA